MKLSYWEYDTWLTNIDFTIVGSGIVGLNCALHLKTRYPKAKILVIEKGFLPQGASTKNAGFACYGSISELLSDLEQQSQEDVVALVQQRWNGIQVLRETLGDAQIGYEQHGGHDLFVTAHSQRYERCLEQLATLNSLLKPIFKKEVFQIQSNTFGFKGVQENFISHTEEAQLDTGKMMQALLYKVQKSGVTILNNVSVEEFQEDSKHVVVKTDQFEFKTRRLCIATNGFAATLLKKNVKPARAQVLITKPIANLPIKGTFHLDEGYYYFRNINDRILLGGGRNLDYEAEETTDLGQTALIQSELERLLNEVILPNKKIKVDHRWSGIMGIGSQKKPIVKALSKNVYCGVRLGGMGVAIGATIGNDLADLIS